MNLLKHIWDLLKKTGQQWATDKVPRLSAALAYYTSLSIAPLLVIAIAVAGLVFGEEAAQNQLAAQISGLVGSDAAKMIQDVIAKSRAPTTNILATIIGVVMLVVAATGVFGELQDSLNTIWEVQPKSGRGIWGIIKDRFLSLTMVLGIGFLLMVSLIVSAVLSALGEWFTGLLPEVAVLLQIANLLVSLAIFVLLFAMLFKFLPDVKIGWSDVWFGALVTAVLFTAGKYLIGLYLGKSGLGSTYGAAGSFVVLLVWIYYSALILFFGAEMTKVYANKYGSRIVPAQNAEPITEEARAQQGIPRQRSPEPVRQS